MLSLVAVRNSFVPTSDEQTRPYLPSCQMYMCTYSMQHLKPKPCVNVIQSKHDITLKENYNVVLSPGVNTCTKVRRKVMVWLINNWESLIFFPVQVPFESFSATAIVFYHINSWLLINGTISDNLLFNNMLDICPMSVGTICDCTWFPSSLFSCCCLCSLPFVQKHILQAKQKRDDACACFDELCNNVRFCSCFNQQSHSHTKHLHVLLSGILEVCCMKLTIVHWIEHLTIFSLNHLTGKKM